MFEVWFCSTPPILGPSIYIYIFFLFCKYFIILIRLAALDILEEMIKLREDSGIIFQSRRYFYVWLDSDPICQSRPRYARGSPSVAATCYEGTRQHRKDSISILSNLALPCITLLTRPDRVSIYSDRLWRWPRSREGRWIRTPRRAAPLMFQIKFKKRCVVTGWPVLGVVLSHSLFFVLSFQVIQCSYAPPARTADIRWSP